MKIEESYNYLLNMPLWNLTHEKIDELNNTVKQLKAQYAEIEKKEPRQFWLDDLELLMPYLKKEKQAKIKK